MSDLVKFRIPAAFILARVVLTAQEVAYGFSHRLDSLQDLSALALAKLESGQFITGGGENHPPLWQL